jgi:hypothetical protein
MIRSLARTIGDHPIGVNAPNGNISVTIMANVAMLGQLCRECDVGLWIVGAEP